MNVQNIFLSILITILFMGLVSPAQVNLVPNPSFEIHDSCPDAVAQIHRALGWRSLNYTPDYFHACSSDPLASVPYNFAGNQNPISSDDSAYAGIITSLLFNQTRDLIGINLSQALVIGQKYYVSFFIVPGSHPSIAPCYNNKYGLKFITYLSSLSSTNLSLVDNFSHYSIDSIVSDTVNWSYFRSSFIADSAYTDILFGNFYTVDSIEYFCVYAGFLRSYYYVDRICVSTDSTYCDLVSGTGLIPMQNPISVVFAKNEVRIHVHEGGTRNMVIYDVAGRMIMIKKLSNGVNFINYTHLSSGMYLMRIDNYTYKFIH